MVKKRFRLVALFIAICMLICANAIFGAIAYADTPAWRVVLIENLSYSDGSVDALQSLLEKQTYGDRSFESIDCLYNQGAADISNAISRLSETSRGQDDVTLISYAGECGASGLRGSDGKILTYAALAEELEKIQGQIYMLIDCQLNATLISQTFSAYISTELVTSNPELAARIYVLDEYQQREEGASDFSTGGEAESILEFFILDDSGLEMAGIDKDRDNRVTMGELITYLRGSMLLRADTASGIFHGVYAYPVDSEFILSQSSEIASETDNAPEAPDYDDESYEEYTVEPSASQEEEIAAPIHVIQQTAPPKPQKAYDAFDVDKDILVSECDIYYTSPTDEKMGKFFVNEWPSLFKVRKFSTKLGSWRNGIGMYVKSAMLGEDGKGSMSITIEIPNAYQLMAFYLGADKNESCELSNGTYQVEIFDEDGYMVYDSGVCDCNDYSDMPIAVPINGSRSITVKLTEQSYNKTLNIILGAYVVRIIRILDRSISAANNVDLHSAASDYNMEVDTDMKHRLICTFALLASLFALCAVAMAEETISLSDAKVRLAPGESFMLATECEAPIWSSSDPSIVSVNKSGELRGNLPGTALVTLQSSSGVACCEVTVTAKPPKWNVVVGGNEKYSIYYPDVEGAARSAELASDLIEDMPCVNINRLLQNVSVDQILQSINDLKRSDMSEDDIAAFIFIGMCSREGLLDFDENVLSYDRLMQELGQLPGRVFILLDCVSYDGSGYDEFASALAGNSADEKYRALYFIQDSQHSYAVKRDNGEHVTPLVDSFLNAFASNGDEIACDKSGDAYVSLRELYEYVDMNMLAYQSSNNRNIGAPSAHTRESGFVLFGEYDEYIPAPTETPTPVPTALPTESPTSVPTLAPTEIPTQSPTEIPAPMPEYTPEPAPDNGDDSLGYNELPDYALTHIPQWPTYDYNGDWERELREYVSLAPWRGTEYSDLDDHPIRQMQLIDLDFDGIPELLISQRTRDPFIKLWEYKCGFGLYEIKVPDDLETMRGRIEYFGPTGSHVWMIINEYEEDGISHNDEFLIFNCKWRTEMVRLLGLREKDGAWEYTIAGIVSSRYQAALANRAFYNNCEYIEMDRCITGVGDYDLSIASERRAAFDNLAEKYRDIDYPVN